MSDPSSSSSSAAAAAAAASAALDDADANANADHANAHDEDVYYHHNHNHNNSIMDNRLNVCLRLRPMNKLEISKRSKDCIHITTTTTTIDDEADDNDNDSKTKKKNNSNSNSNNNNNNNKNNKKKKNADKRTTTVLTVDSPLQGQSYAFSKFQSNNAIFDELATHHDVYHTSGLATIPMKLLNYYYHNYNYNHHYNHHHHHLWNTHPQGIDCTVLAFGPTGTGKSHLLLGGRGGGGDGRAAAAAAAAGGGSNSNLNWNMNDLTTSTSTTTSTTQDDDDDDPDALLLDYLKQQQQQQQQGRQYDRKDPSSLLSSSSSSPVLSSSHGILIRIVTDLFRLVHHNPDQPQPQQQQQQPRPQKSLEEEDDGSSPTTSQPQQPQPPPYYIIKFSMVELYMEQWIDLLAFDDDQNSNNNNNKTKNKKNDSIVWVESSSSNNNNTSSSSSSSTSKLHGAVELCCVNAQDVIRAVIRGRQMHRMGWAATQHNSDAARSTIIYQLQVVQQQQQQQVVSQQQVSTTTATSSTSIPSSSTSTSTSILFSSTSTLRIVDLAGSEWGKSKSSRQLDSPLALEGRMVSASLQSMIHYVRSKQQGGATTTTDGNNNNKSSSSRRTSRMMSPPSSSSSSNKPLYMSKLTKYLQSSLDGPCFTTVFLTCSPSSYSVSDTLQTLRFGEMLQQLKLKSMPTMIPTTTTTTTTSTTPTPTIIIENPWIRLQQAEQRAQHLTQFVKLLAVECRMVRKTGKIKQPHAVWDVISRIAKSSTSEDEAGASDLVISVTSRKKQQEEELASSMPDHISQETMRQAIQEAQQVREKAESQIRDVQSELAALRAEREHLKAEQQRVERERKETQAELLSVKEAKSEVDQELQTSRFREKEAIVFLRQFRSFYWRLLKSKAAHGSSGSSIDAAIMMMTVNDTILHQVPGAADLNALLDVDRVMIQSGLIESDELGEDTNDPNYSPSQIAIQKSEMEAEQAQEREQQILFRGGGGGGGGGRTGTMQQLLLEPGNVTVYRQKLVESPAGRLAIQKEKELEANIIQLSNKCAALENAVNAEKAMVEALSTRQGALGKMKAAQEMHALKAEFERRSNDLQAIVWKMNELHLVNKTVNEKAENREQQVAYLEESLATLKHKNRQLLSEKLENEKKLRAEKDHVLTQLECSTVKLWQLGEIPRPASSYRIVVPASGVPMDLLSPPSSTLVAERRITLDDIANEGLEILEPPPKVATSITTPSITTTEMSVQTDEIVLDIDDTAVQTDPVQIFDMEEKVVLPKSTTAEYDLTSDDMTASITKDSTDSAANSQGTTMQTRGDELHFDVGVQTEESQPFHETTAYFAQPKAGVLMVDAGMQTERERTKICFEVCTQTDGLPDEIALLTTTTPTMMMMRRSYPSGGSLDEQDDEENSPRPDQMLSRNKRPPNIPHWKSTSADRSFSKLDANNNNNTNMMMIEGHNSSSSLGSFGQFASTSMDQQRGGVPSLGGSMKWNTTTSSDTTPPLSRTADSTHRLGGSMPVLQGPTVTPSTGQTSSNNNNSNNNRSPPASATDWRAKLRNNNSSGKTNEPAPLPPTPSRSRSLAIGSKPSWTPSSTVTSKSNNSIKGPVSPSPARRASFSKKAEGTNSNAATAAAAVPEWMVKFKEMGIPQAPEDLVDEADSSSSSLPRTPRNNNNAKSSSSSPMTSSSSFSAAAASAAGGGGGRHSIFTHPSPTTTTTTAEKPGWMQKLKSPQKSGGKPSIGISSNNHDHHPKGAEQPQEGPEWMQRFKEIGMKGEEEQIIESSRGGGGGDDTTAVEQLQVSGPAAAAAATDPSPKPEWMLKRFRQIGHGKGVTEN